MSWRGAAARRQAGSPEINPGNGFQALIVSRQATKRLDGNGSLKPNGLRGKLQDRFEDVGRERRPGCGNQSQDWPSPPESERLHRGAGFYRKWTCGRAPAH